MNLTRGIMTSVIAAGLAAVGLASPAAADDDGSGTYAFNLVNGGEPSTWIVTTCGTLCLHVSDTGNSKYGPWESEAYALNGYLTMFVDRPDMITCDDGTTLPGHAAYYWDQFGNGLVETTNVGACGGAPGPTSEPFTLTK